MRLPNKELAHGETGALTPNADISGVAGLRHQLSG